MGCHTKCMRETEFGQILTFASAGRGGSRAENKSYLIQKYRIAASEPLRSHEARYCMTSEGMQAVLFENKDFATEVLRFRGRPELENKLCKLENNVCSSLSLAPPSALSARPRHPFKGSKSSPQGPQMHPRSYQKQSQDNPKHALRKPRAPKSPQRPYRDLPETLRKPPGRSQKRSGGARIRMTSA